ncbi:hypothetical protein PSYCG_10010 [Psychrobacter sp. G]|uniref:hypothetical protein n=1 Tax=Psychrobacter sp. G TaxID=571800 RepID=UPI000354C5BB|nr:hypothetical protein [Psychrobacter sp. G]AGP49489.1 hypothetical protein PSYCG_10010 [Psychrobacter sp. G]
MPHSPTTQAPVSDVAILSTAHNPFRLTDDIRDSLSEVFCAAFHAHKSDYLERKQWLIEHLAKEDRDQKHDANLVALCHFSERYMRNTAKTYKSIMGSDFWIEQLELVIQENNHDA